MVARKKVAVEEPEEKLVPIYFKQEPLQFIRTGCTLLDCVLGGGWPLGRVSNIVGDRSSGKTLLAIEATANFARQFPDGHIWYREAEAAFDEGYAVTLGLPVDRVDFGPEGVGSRWDTVEDVFNDMMACIEQAKESGQPGLYIIDSLDAISSDAEMARKVGEATFGGEKPKMMGELFRKLIRELGATKIHVMVISQVRDKIGFTMGEKHTRTGGKALDFYATHIVWLAHLKQLTRTINKVKRVTGIQVKAKAKKNKVNTPFLECDFNIRFAYGIDDYVASLDWLTDVGRLKDLGLTEAKVDAFIKKLDEMPSGPERNAELERVHVVTTAVWDSISLAFAPPRPKYE